MEYNEYKMSVQIVIQITICTKFEENSPLTCTVIHNMDFGEEIIDTHYRTIVIKWPYSKYYLQNLNFLSFVLSRWVNCGIEYFIFWLLLLTLLKHFAMILGTTVKITHQSNIFHVFNTTWRSWCNRTVMRTLMASTIG